jgi:tRNA (guanine10-N2)-methyltransferase
LKFTGPVQMNEPTNEFVMIREIELDNNGGPLLQQQKCHTNHGRYPSIACYFGRALGGCRSIRRMGGNMQKYDLKQRKYLGPTSMDAELSFVMTNFGQVKAGQIVFDPFVGTGSILLSCALRGAYCVGTDIDIRVLRGRSVDENIYSNFRQFHLPRPELIRSDNGIYHRHFRYTEPLYDAILCDPPYGIRAGARKSGSKREHIEDVKPENRHDHIAQTQTYAVSDVMADLMDVAARVLLIGGRLVYVIPSFASTFDIEMDLPQHPCLELVHVCYQPFSAELGRRVVVMKKKLSYDPTKRDDFLLATWKNGTESADKCADIRTKIIELAKTKPRYEERAAIRKEKRRLHREEKKEAKKNRTKCETGSER